MARLVALVFLSLLAGGEAAVRTMSMRKTGGECADSLSGSAFTSGKATLKTFTESDVVSAKLIAIEYFGTYKVVTEKRSKELYILTQCGTTKPSTSDLAAVVAKHVNYTVKHFTIPLQTASSSSTIHNAFFKALGLEDRIKYISGSSVDPCWQKALGCGAKFNSSDPSHISGVDAYFMDCGWPNKCKIVNDQPKAIHISASQDPAPLHSAEHIKFVAAFFNKEALATKLFAKTVTDYASASVVRSGTKPVVAWIAFNPASSWSPVASFVLSQAHYKLKMVADAGGTNVKGSAVMAAMGSKMSLAKAATGNTYTVKTDSFDKTVATTSKAFFAALAGVDVIIDETYNPLPRTYTFDKFMTTMGLGGLSEQERIKVMGPWKFMMNKKVLAVDGTITNGNALDWYESRIAHPEWAVEGLARQIHSDMKMPYKFFRNIADKELPQVVNASSCTSTPSACLASAYPALISMMVATATGTTSTTGTTGGTTASTKVEGSVTVVAAGVTKAQVEAASKTALAEHFAVASSRLTTTATETRRLGVDGNDRRLAGTWTIAYNFLALPAEVASINTKVATAKSAPDAFKTALATKFKAGLKKAGVSAAVADALVVNSATSVAATTSATTGGTTGSTASGAKRANFDGVFKAFAVVLLLLRTLTSN